MNLISNFDFQIENENSFFLGALKSGSMLSMLPHRASGSEKVINSKKIK